MSEAIPSFEVEMFLSLRTDLQSMEDAGGGLVFMSCCVWEWLNPTNGATMGLFCASISVPEKLKVPGIPSQSARTLQRDLHPPGFLMYR